MDWGNCFIRVISRNAEGKVTGLEGELNPTGSVKTTKRKVTWLATTDIVPLKLQEFDYLITKPKLDEGDDFKDYITPNICVETEAVGDANLRTLAKGDAIQLERRGFYICDVPYKNPKEAIVLIYVPDGKSKNVSVLSSKISLGARTKGQSATDKMITLCQNYKKDVTKTFFSETDNGTIRCTKNSIKQMNIFVDKWKEIFISTGVGVPSKIKQRIFGHSQVENVNSAKTEALKIYEKALLAQAALEAQLIKE